MRRYSCRHRIDILIIASIKVIVGDPEEPVRFVDFADKTGDCCGAPNVVGVSYINFLSYFDVLHVFGFSPPPVLNDPLSMPFDFLWLVFFDKVGDQLIEHQTVVVLTITDVHAAYQAFLEEQ